MKHLGAVASAAIKALFVNIPSMLTGIFDGVISWVGYLGVKLRNTLVEAVQNFIRDAGARLQGTWVDKLFGLGSALAGVDFGIDRSGEEKLLSQSINAFSSVGQGFESAVSDAVDAADLIRENTKDISELYSSIDGIKVSVPEYTEVAAEIKETGRLTEALLSLSDRFADKTEDNTVEWREITGKFAALLSPEIERWEKESGETIGEKLASWTAKSGDEYLDVSKKSFASIGKTLTEWGITFKDETISELDALWGSVSTYMGDLFGDDIGDFSDWLQVFLEDHREAVVTAVDDAASKIISEEKKRSVSSDILSGAWDSAITSAVKDADGNALSVFSAETGIANITSSLSSSFSSLLSAIGPVIDAFSSGAWWMAALTEIMEGFVTVMVPAINAVLAPVKDALQWIGQSLALVLVPVLDALMPAMTFIQRILTELMTPALQILSPIIETVASVLDALTPIIALVGKAFTILMSPVQFVADLFSWLGDWLQFFGECVGVCAWNITHWFDTRAFPDTPGGFSSDAFSGLQGRLDAWDTLEASKGAAIEAAGNSVSSSTALSSASYQGGTHVTINIYQEAPVVGDGGMKAFARMIRDEFEELDYYGVTG